MPDDEKLNPYPCTTPAEAEAERCVVGICLAWPERVREIDLLPEHFANPRYRVTFEAIQSLDRDRQPVDPGLVAAMLQRAGKPIGYADLAAMALELPSGDNVAHYAELVRDASVRRRVGDLCAVGVRQASMHHDAAEVLGEVQRKIAEISLEQPSASLPIFELLKGRYRELLDLTHARQRGEAVSTGIPMGIPKLDEVLGGLQVGIVTLCAARPRMGKSSFGHAVVRHASARGIGCHVFSLEDTRDAYCDRVISAESGIPAEQLRSLDLGPAEMGKANWAAEQFSRGRPWLVDDRSGITADEVVRCVRRHAKENRTRLVVVDYVTLLRPPRGVMRGEDAVTYAVNALADAAKQDRMAYLVLAQLNRECEKRDNKRPILSDLKQAGSLEERAKAVIFLHRGAVYGEKQDGIAVPESELELIVAKNSNGRTGTAKAHWEGRTMRIS